MKRSRIVLMTCALALVLAGLASCGSGGLPMTSDGYPDAAQLIGKNKSDVEQALGKSYYKGVAFGTTLYASSKETLDSFHNTEFEEGDWLLSLESSSDGSIEKITMAVKGASNQEEYQNSITRPKVCKALEESMLKSFNLAEVSYNSENGEGTAFNDKHQVTVWLDPEGAYYALTFFRE